MVLSLNMGWSTRQVDFSNAFIQAEMEEDVFINVPSHFENEDGLTSKNVVSKLNKNLCGLVQAPMCWFDHLSGVLQKKGFKPSNHDQRAFHGCGIIILVCIDDCLLF